MKSVDPCEEDIMVSYEKHLKESFFEDLLKLKALRECLYKVLGHLRCQSPNNELTYEVYNQAVHGYIIELSEFGKNFLEFFCEIKGQYLNVLKRNRWKKHANFEELKQLWDCTFPSEKSREKGQPSHDDLDRLKSKVKNSGGKILNHRNKISAHNRLGNNMEHVRVKWKDCLQVEFLKVYFQEE